MLVCSFLGGMRAVTETQVARHIILLLAYLTPVASLSVKQTGVPVSLLVYGYQLEKVTARVVQLTADPEEQKVRTICQQRSEVLAEKLRQLALALTADRLTAAGGLAAALSAADGLLLTIANSLRHDL